MNTYYKLNSDFWLEVTDDVPPEGTPATFRVLHQTLPEGLSIKTRAQLRALGFPYTPSWINSVLKTDKVLSIFPTVGTFGIRTLQGRNWQHEKALLSVEHFRRSTRQQLMQSIFSRDATLDSVLRAFADFAFFNEYSLWLFNPDTEFFTHMCSSFAIGKTYLHKNDPQSPLGEVLASGDATMSGPVDHRSVNSEMLTEMQWVNRFKVHVRIGQTGKELIAIVSLYSPAPGYNIREDTRNMISEMVTLELSKTVLIYLFQYNELMAQLRGQPDLTNVRTNFQRCVESVATGFGYEAVSLFLLPTQEAQHLDLIALEEHNRRDPATLNAVYPLTGKSKTATVFRDQKLQFSYHIAQDRDNSHIFDEQTKNPPTNWLGIPVVAGHQETLGVLRVKNKCAKGKPEHFTSVDIMVLRNLASAVAFIYRNALTLAHEQAQNDRRQREYEDLKAFLATFRHEIKSPLTYVAEAPGLAARVLRDENICDEQHLPKRVANLLADMTMIGNRLVFVSQALTFSAADLVKEVTVRHAYQDVLAPVLAFAVPYAAKRRKTITVDKDSLLRRIHCHALSASMAFHVLLDNAIKYTEEGDTIRVFGNEVGESLHVIVVNPVRVFKITAKDMTGLFTKYFRGEIPRAQNMEGSGIGLHLAKAIVERQKGNIALRTDGDTVRCEVAFQLDRS